MVLFNPASQDRHGANVMPIRNIQWEQKSLLTCRSCLCCLAQVARTRFFALDRIGTQAPVSYPSIVFYAVAEICVMHLSGTLNVGEESPSSHNECTKGICSESDNVVGLRE
jgi:hypothetical protein